MKITERWLPVKGYENLYEVSDMGRVRSLNYHREGKVKELKPKITRGYLQLYLYKNENRKMFSVHRLVYEAFCGPIPKGLTVDHVNGIKTDNRLSNLQLLSAADNARKANNKQLDLIEVDYPYREYTFKNSLIAGEFFNYKRKDTVIWSICQARKRGRNYINLRGTKYYFSQKEA